MCVLCIHVMSGLMDNFDRSIVCSFVNSYRSTVDTFAVTSVSHLVLLVGLVICMTTVSLYCCE